MSHTIFYKGNVKHSDLIPVIMRKAIEKANEYGWEVMVQNNDGVVLQVNIAVPNSEYLSLCMCNGKLNGMTKLDGENNQILGMVFDLIWELKPYFKQLKVTDDYGAWDIYVLKKTNKKPLELPVLSMEEKKELDCDFNGSIGKNALFFTTPASVLIMDMVCKDLGIYTKEDLLASIEGDAKTFWEEIKNSNSPDYCKNHVAFCAVIRAYTLKIIVKKSGKPIISNPQKDDLSRKFARLMLELVCGEYEPGSGVQYTKLVKFHYTLTEQDGSFDDKETILRYIYCVMDTLNCMRPTDFKIAKPPIVK